MPVPKVLFLCGRNSARSQMAEAFLNLHGGEFFEAHSAGLEPSEIHPLTIEVMLEKGIDLIALGHRSKGIWEEYVSRHVMIGYLVTVCERAEARCPIYPGPHAREDWGVPDPDVSGLNSRESLELFRNTRDIIEERVKDFIARHHGD